MSGKRPRRGRDDCLRAGISHRAKEVIPLIPPVKCVKALQNRTFAKVRAKNPKGLCPALAVPVLR